MITAVDHARRVDRAFIISSAVSTGTTSMPFGVGIAVGPVTRTTWAPLAWAASAMAYPILPEDRFEMKPSGSIGSCVGPRRNQQTVPLPIAPWSQSLLDR